MKATTLGALVNAQPALGRLTSKTLPYKTAYALKRVKAGVQHECEYFNEEREKLIKEYGAERDATDQEQQMGMQSPVTAVTPEHAAAWMAKLKELLEVEVALQWVLTPAILESFEVTADDLVLLDAMTEDDVPEAKPEAKPLELVSA